MKRLLPDSLIYKLNTVKLLLLVDNNSSLFLRPRKSQSNKKLHLQISVCLKLRRWWAEDTQIQEERS